MKDTIVVGVALHSEAGRRSGQRAIAWAAERAMDRHQRLELLSIVGGAVGMVGEAHLIDQARDDLRSQLEAEARTLTDAHPDRLDVRVRVDHGNPVAKLIDASKDAALLVIGLGMTALVYGAVALLVKIDDVGLRLMKSSRPGIRRTGARVVASMPTVFRVIGIIGTVAMLWVGGHILLVGVDELGWHALYDAVHHLEEQVHDALGAVGATAAWLVNTAASAALGLLVGAVVVALAHLRPRRGSAANS